MIPCPHCEREFEKRAGLMRHVTVSHPHEPVDPVESEHQGLVDDIAFSAEPETYAETYAESLDELAPGQEPYVDPDAWHERSAGIVEPPAHLTMSAPTTEQYKQIRAFIRSGRSEWEAWMNVVGHEPPPRPPQPVDGRPLRLQQVAFRVRNGGTDQIDARWLLHLAEIGADAVATLGELLTFTDREQEPSGLLDVDAKQTIDRWKAAIQ